MRATLEADFNDFIGGLDKVGVTLRQRLIVDVDKASGRLQTLTDSLDGNKTLQQAAIMAAALGKVGGAATLTDRELARIAPTIDEAVQKFQRLGQSVPSDLAKAKASIDDMRRSMEQASRQSVAPAAKFDTSALTGVGAALTVGVGAAFAVTSRAAIQFESAFANVKKTVNGTEAEIKALEAGIREMAQTIPPSAADLSDLAAIGGQFGISTPGLLKFTRTIADLGVAIDGISADEAAASLAQIANVTKTSEHDFDRLASTLVRLGNEGNSTEGQVLELTKRLSGAGTQAGLTVAEIFGLAGAIANVGVEAEAGGSAVSKVLLAMKDATIDGGDALRVFAAVAGQSAEDFAAAFKSTPTVAVQAFLDGLGRIQAAGGSLTQVFDALELKDSRLKDTLGRLALSAGDVGKQVASATDEFRRNTALTEEAGKKYSTTENQLRIFHNRINDINITLGGPTLQAMNAVIEAMTPLLERVASLAKAFADLPPETRSAVVGLGAGVGLAGVLAVLAAKAAEAGRDVASLATSLKGLLAAEAAAGSVGALSGSVGALAGNLGRLRALLPGAGAAAGGPLGIVVAASIAAFSQATDAVDDYSSGLGRFVDQQLVLAEARNVLGRDAASFDQAWVTASLSLDRATKSGSALTKQQTELKRALDALNPYLDKRKGGLDLSNISVGPAIKVGTAPPKLPTPGPTPAELAELDATKRRLAALTGRNILDAATQSVVDVFGKNGKGGIGVGALSDASALKIFDQLADAKLIAARLEPGLVAGFTEAMQKLESSNAVMRVATQKAGKRLVDGLFDRNVLRAGVITGIDTLEKEISSRLPEMMQRSLAVRQSVIDAGEGLIAGAVDPNTWNTSERSWSGIIGEDALDAIYGKLDRTLKKTTDWRTSVRGVSSAFANLAQVAGGAFDGISRSIGSVFGAADAALETVTSLGKQFKKLKLTEGEDNNLTGRGSALVGGLAGLSIGAQLGGYFTNRGAGFAAGAGGGALAGGTATGWNPYGVAVGALVGGFAGMWTAAANAKAQRRAKDVSAAQLASQFGGLEGLLNQVDVLGLNQQSFLERYYGSPSDFAKAVTELNDALEKERVAADKLAKSLGDVSRMQGVLSTQQIGDIGAVRPGSAGEGPLAEFFAAQRDQVNSGLSRAAAALAGAATLSNDEISALTDGIRDQKERDRVLEDALNQKAADVFARYGAGVNATAAGLFVAFDEATARGLSAVDALKTLQDPLATITSLYERAGKTPGAGFQQLQSLYGIVTDAQTAPAVEIASGLGGALSGLFNQGLLSQDLFGDLTAGITESYDRLEALGKGGVDAARLMQPGLQSMWQLQHDFGFELDANSQKLLDFAESSGLIGDQFRPAAELMVDGINEVVDRLDVLIQTLGGELPAAAQRGARATAGAATDAGPTYPSVPGSTGGVGVTDASWEVTVGEAKVDLHLDGDILAEAVIRRLPGRVDRVA